MKKLLYLMLVASITMYLSCGSDEEEDEISENTIYKQYMRSFVQGISAYAAAINPDFIIIPQNGPELVTTSGNEDDDPDTIYLKAINGVGREDLFYGYNDDDEATPAVESEYMITFLNICEQFGVEVLTTDYCSSHAKMDDSYSKNEAKGYISFAAPLRELSVIPEYPDTIYNENSDDIHTLAEAKNFLYLINPVVFSSNQAMISALKFTNYDIIIMDLFFMEMAFTAEEINQLKLKKNGGERLVIAYLSIGEAEDYRYYWDNSWKVGSPSWLQAENPDWEGNYKVQYWDPEWQEIIYGNENAYLDKIIDAGFDGAYLDIIDAFEYFE